MQRLPLFVRLLIALSGAAAAGIVFFHGLDATWWGLLTGGLLAGGGVLGLTAWLHRQISDELHHAVLQLRRLRSAFESVEPFAASWESSGAASRRSTDHLFGRLLRNVDDVAGAASRRIQSLEAANRELERSDTLFQSILSTMVEGVLVLDARGRILYLNEAARKQLECRERDVEGRLLWEVVRSGEIQEVMEEVHATGHECRQEFELKRGRRRIEMAAARLPLAPEPGLVAVLHDVTELRRLERLRREFVSNVSHELKTPLTSIQAYADTLLEGGLEDEENSRLFVSRIIEQSDRLQALIQDMLRLARIESQSAAYRFEPILLADVLSECIEARTPVARARSVELRLVPGAASAEVLADRTGLRTIFDNLVTNALNYTPEGGHVQVGWEVLEGDVVIDVRDDGIGIAAGDQERIFERFYRVDQARSRGMGGTGLGLAIVKHLTYVFGGEVRVESTVGQGSRFQIRLPLARLRVPRESTQPAGPR